MSSMYKGECILLVMYTCLVVVCAIRVYVSGRE